MAALAVIAMLAVLLGCTPSSASPTADVDHAATVEALLPTAEPTEPPAAADPTVASADTPAAPTYTPRPRPTYTPRPAPTRAGSGERAAATPFQAELLDGTEITLSDTFGTPTLLAFWAHW